MSPRTTAFTSDEIRNDDKKEKYVGFGRESHRNKIRRYNKVGFVLFSLLYLDNKIIFLSEDDSFKWGKYNVHVIVFVLI